MNVTLIKILLKIVLEYSKGWAEMLKWAIWAYNTTFRRLTGYEPFYLKYGVHSRLLIDLQTPNKAVSDEDGILLHTRQLQQLHNKRVSVHKTL